MSKKQNNLVEEQIVENISVEPLENVMSDRYATYAKYVIQDRAIPDVRDGLKPVQRRIIFTMFKSNNTFNKPTKKCAHTVGAVMGTFHPHGDTSIYEALARMSQDWKVRYPLIDFQGNNGSIDGDLPAAYRYTESRLSELSNELIRDIEKKTVDMQPNFDDTEYEPIVLPSRFPNLLVNGTEGIAVALATEIPPHNLREVIEAVIYRINHKTSTCEDLLQFVKGPDFPGGGIIYNSDGLKNIYLQGRGRIEIASKYVIEQEKDHQKIIITEIPYKIVKSQLVYEIDKIIHSKSVSGMTEIRDESDYKGIRIVIDCKKDAKCDLLIKYLMDKTSLCCGYTANMVAIDNGRPKTLTLLDFVDAYLSHQKDVVLRGSKFDLDKFSNRLHIVEGLILAALNINEIVEIIRKSKDKTDSKINLMNRYKFSNEQAEAILIMPLYKLSHTDEIILREEKTELEKNIDFLKGIIEDESKLNRYIIKDLKSISDKYGDDRRSQIVEKGEVKPIDKRELIAKEETIVVVSRDGYIKRSSVKSYKGSGENSLPGLKEGDAIVSIGQCFTTDYLVCFTNLGNYICLSVHTITENKWKEEGLHINNLVSLDSGEKFIKSIIIRDFRNDLYLAFLTRLGQIKRMPLSALEATKRSKTSKCMKLLSSDELIQVQLLKGNSQVLVITNNGYCSMYNENELSIIGPKAGGVKSINGLNKANAIGLLSFDPNEKSKIAIITDKGCQRILNSDKIPCTSRLSKTTQIVPIFKSDIHNLVSAIKILDSTNEFIKINSYLNNGQILEILIDDLHHTDLSKYAKSNIKIPSKTLISNVYDTNIEIIDKNVKSYPIVENNSNKQEIIEENQTTNDLLGDEELLKTENKVEENSSKDTLNDDKTITKPKKDSKKDEDGYEQISIFDDLE